MQISLESVACLDFEASSLGRTGYPIEVAVVDCATGRCSAWLIRPTDEWLRHVKRKRIAHITNMSADALISLVSEQTAEAAGNGGDVAPSILVNFPCSPLLCASARLGNTLSDQLTVHPLILFN